MLWEGPLEWLLKMIGTKGKPLSFVVVEGREIFFSMFPSAALEDA